MKYYFYDTCSLLSENKTLFNDSNTMIIISSITISELEGIKTSYVKDEETKYAARQVVRLLEKNEGKYKIILYNPILDKTIEVLNLPNTNDSKIVVSAYNYFKENNILQTAVFKTKDLICKRIAESLNLKIEYLYDNFNNNYTGYKEVVLDEDSLAYFYTDIYRKNINEYNLYENEYLIIKDTKDNIQDFYKWKNGMYKEVPFKTFDSDMFGSVRPVSKDVYQQLAFDAISNNKITVLRGPAGSGKSMIALSYMFSLLDKGTIGKIIIFCNTVATKGAAKLGYLPGTRLEKLLESQIGIFLESKIGNKYEVEKLIETNKLLILPMSDIRGYDTSGMNAAVYITEAQNTSVDLMKLALQRIGSDSICILDGDDTIQVDLNLYEGSNNGLRRVSEVFRGQEYYGEVTLKNVKRSKIAAQAELM